MGIVKNGILENIILVDDSDMEVLKFIEADFFIDSDDYNFPLGVGMEVSSDKSIKDPLPAPFPSWTWSKEEESFLPPVPRPNDVPTKWDEETLSWVEVTDGDA